MLLVVLGARAWRFYQGWKFATQDEGIPMLAVEYFELQEAADPRPPALEWLAGAVQRERQGEASKVRLAFLELLTAEQLVLADRKQEALVLFGRHLPQHGAWENYLDRRQTLTKWGLVAWQRGDYATANLAMDAALECDPGNASSLRIKGLVVKKLTADLEETRRWFQRSLEANTEEQRPLQSLKVCWYAAGLRADLGDLAGAVEEVQAALAAFLAPGRTMTESERVEVGGIVLGVTRLLCRLGRAAEARKAFDGFEVPRLDRGIEMEWEAVKLELGANEGQAAAAVPVIAALVDEAKRRKDDDGVGEYSVAQAHIEALAGRMDAAAQALEVARQTYARCQSKSDLAAVDQAARRLRLSQA